MKNKNYMIAKISILAVIAVVLIGILVFLLIDGTRYHWKWNFKKDQIMIYEKTYAPLELDQINIDVTSTDITVKPSQDDQIHITIYGEKEEEATSKLENNQLTIIKNSKNHLCFGFCFANNNEIILSLPSEIVTTLNFKTASGDIWIGNFDHVSLDAETSSGDIEFDTVKQANLKTQSGDMEGKNIENVNGDTSSGSIHFSRIVGYTNLKTSSGDIQLNDFQILKNSNIVTSSGDVTVFHITDCYINTKTRSGDVHIKENNRFLEIELQIETSSGDIDVR